MNLTSESVIKVQFINEQLFEQFYLVPYILEMFLS